MPGTNNDSDDQLEDGIEETEESSEEILGEPEETSEDSGSVDKSEKRIRDLQSKADAAEARANKAEASLKIRGADKGDGAGPNPETVALMQELREAGLDSVYAEFPELKKYGVERSLIEGSTRAEMREAATSVVGFIKSLSTKVRNETLSEHGIKAEPVGATRRPPVNYESMSDEDFLKLLNSSR